MRIALLAKLGVWLLALMMACFVLLIHVPGVILAPGDRMQWMMLAITLSITGRRVARAAAAARACRRARRPDSRSALA